MKWLHPRFTQVSWQFGLKNSKQRCPAAWQKCLESPLSLTKRMEALYQEPIQVCILKEGWRQSTAKESHKRNAWVREVVMLAGDTPLLLAKTTIPLKAAQKQLRLVCRLGDRPLGKLLYAEPTLKRTSIKIYPLPNNLWGRSSWFLFAGASLFLEECFLPAFLERLRYVGKREGCESSAKKIPPNPPFSKGGQENQRRY